MADAVGQLSRLLSLVPYLLARPGARIDAVAREFGVTPAQLRRDLDLVFLCGLPGYLPDDLIEVDICGEEIYLRNADTIARPLRLSTHEALALLVGLRALAELPGVTDREALLSTIAKLEDAAGELAEITAAVQVTFETEDRAYAIAQLALERGRRLRLSYYVPTRDEVTERDVDPMRVVFADGRAYLEGWCHRAEAVRLFRLGRVVAIHELDEPASVPVEARPLDLDGGLLRPSPGDTLVTLELAPAGRWVAEYYVCETITELGGGRLRVTLRAPDTRLIVRLGLQLGETGSVVGPSDVRALVCQAANTALAGYGELDELIGDAQPLDGP